MTDTRIDAWAWVKDASGTMVKAAKNGENVYLWICGPGGRLSIVTDRENLLIIRDAIDAFEESDKLAASGAFNGEDEYEQREALEAAQSLRT